MSEKNNQNKDLKKDENECLYPNIDVIELFEILSEKNIRVLFYKRDSLTEAQLTIEFMDVVAFLDK